MKATAQIEDYLELPEEVRQKLELELPRREVRQEEDISYTSKFTDIHKKASAFAKEWKKTIKDVSVEHSYTEDYGSYSSEVHLEVQGLETDQQYYKRLLEYHDANTRRETWERQEFERLKSKFSK